MIKVTENEFYWLQEAIGRLNTKETNGIVISQALKDFADALDLISCHTVEDIRIDKFLPLLKPYRVKVHYQCNEHRNAVNNALENTYNLPDVTETDINMFKDYVNANFDDEDIYGLVKKVNDKIAFYPIDPQTALSLKVILRNVVDATFEIEGSQTIHTSYWR